jgi:hypothetical protein
MSLREMSNKQMRTLGALFAFLFFAVSFASCQQSGSNPLVSASPTQNPSPAATVSRPAELISAALDGMAIPAGWMSGGGNPKPFISLGSGQKDCLDHPGCTRIEYKAGGQWGGIFWWPQRCGDSGTDEAWQKCRSGNCGINVLKAGGVSEVTRLKFFARGERGGEGIEFKVGAVDMAPKPGRSTGRVTLTKNWEPREIDLRGMDLSNACALFAWIATDAANSKGATFYLDNIRFEGVR